jgi:hypothetical protein
MSDASEYPAGDGDPVTPEKSGHPMTDVLTALAQRIVDGHPYSTATAEHLTITVLVDPDPETDPTADNPDAYTYTHEAIAAFRRGDWSFTTITLSIYLYGVRARAVQRGVDHALAAPDGEHDYLAGSLLPDLLAEAEGNLRAATDGLDTRTGTNSRRPQDRRSLIPATLTDDGYPVLAWIPTFSTDDSAIAIGYRPEPEYDHAPYVVWTVRARPNEPGRYHIIDGSEAEDLGEATLEAIALAEQDTTRAAEEHDPRDGSPS